MHAPIAFVSVNLSSSSNRSSWPWNCFNLKASIEIDESTIHSATAKTMEPARARAGRDRCQREEPAMREMKE